MFANYQLIARLLTLHSAATSADLLNTNKTELILAIPYQGDALRVYYKDTLLTDNFYSGYSSEQGGAVVEGYVEIWAPPAAREVRREPATLRIKL
jgi:hypothetical protein